MSFNKNESQSQDNPNVETNQIMFQVFDYVASKIDSYQTQTVIKDTLLKKRKRVSTTEEYIETLARNIAYYLEYQKQIENLLMSMIDQKSFLSLQDIEGHLYNARNQTQSILPSLTKPVLEVYHSKFTTNNQRIENLEFDYSFYSIRNNLMLDGIICIINNQNITIPLFFSPSLFVAECFKKYIDIKVGLILGSLSFEKL